MITSGVAAGAGSSGLGDVAAAGVASAAGDGKGLAFGCWVRGAGLIRFLACVGFLLAGVVSEGEPVAFDVCDGPCANAVATMQIKAKTTDEWILIILYFIKFELSTR